MIRSGIWDVHRLSIHLYVLALACILIGAFSGGTVLYIIGLAFVVVSMFRIYSKNVSKRQKELAAYERILAKPGAFLSLQKSRWKFRKTYKYFKCSCGAILCVSKGKGKIQITCPKCHKQIIRKT